MQVEQIGLIDRKSNEKTNEKNKNIRGRHQPKLA